MSEGVRLPGPYGFEPTWPMPDLGHRYGTVYVHEEVEDPPDNAFWTHADKVSDPSLAHYFIASWQAEMDGILVFAPYFRFENLDAAVAWGRERARCVRLVIYEGEGIVAYSAGDDPVGDLPEWDGR